MTASANSDVLAAITPKIGNGYRVAARRQLGLPEHLPGLGIESAKVSIERRCNKNEFTGGDAGSAEVLLPGDGDALGGQFLKFAERDLPGDTRFLSWG